MQSADRVAVGGINGLVVVWLADPKASPPELAAACTRLSLAVIALGG